MPTVDIAFLKDGFYKIIDSTDYYVEIKGITATLYRLHDERTNSFELICSNIYLGVEWQNKLIECEPKEKQILY